MRILLVPALTLAALALPGAARAQSNLDARVDRLEHEMRAVQRKVFPEGAGRYFEPQITPTAPQQQAAPGAPVSGPIVNLESRVQALESQVADLTGNVEQTSYRIRQLQDAFDAYRKKTDARLDALESAAAGRAGPASETDAHGNGTLSPPSGAEPVEKPEISAERAEKVASIEHPDTGDEAEDAYIYGYRLWEAGLYPEAEAQLKSVVEKYPDSRRASFAQNLLGRAYLDDGKPSLASIAFYDNYKKMPNGERAPDSLFYLAKALIKLKKPEDACQVYAELSDVYGEQISASMQAGIAEGRETAGCN
ncbi:tetratricopeptide repeat protein [Stakelama saccharophila]|uniref:TolA-binding protein n=1 Tax=Stakelama saccharophila TaxID=3075605 RepID=A0ABZ0B9M9_9SPHN|nr:tetratricopeptide repeat protein [Stakelama sp. W311]WNO53967.1 hypothetical protein RPR59_01520 [Stakelama sp. W311]